MKLIYIPLFNLLKTQTYTQNRELKNEKNKKKEIKKR